MAASSLSASRSGCPNDNCDVTNDFARVLERKRYDVVRVTQNGAAHDWAFWRDRLAGLLSQFRDGQTACSE